MKVMIFNIFLYVILLHVSDSSLNNVKYLKRNVTYDTRRCFLSMWLKLISLHYALCSYFSIFTLI